MIKAHVRKIKNSMTIKLSVCLYQQCICPDVCPSITHKCVCVTLEGGCRYKNHTKKDLLDMLFESVPEL